MSAAARPSSSAKADAKASTDQPDAATYREAYATLQRVVGELESGDTDLDRVLPLLDEARAAYSVCEGRIASVRRALEGADWLRGGAEENDAEESEE